MRFENRVISKVTKNIEYPGAGLLYRAATYN